MKTDWERDYVYSYSFDFNSFTPISMDEVKEIKAEIKFCEKYGLDHNELDEKLSSFNLSKEVLEMI